MEKNKILKYLGILLVIIVVICIYIKEDNVQNPIPASKLTKQEQLELQIDNLKEENNHLTEELSEANSEIDDLKLKYKYTTDLIDLLRDQLKYYGIEPYEL